MSRTGPPPTYRAHGPSKARSVSSFRSLEPPYMRMPMPIGYDLRLQRGPDWLVHPGDSISNVSSTRPSSPTIIEYPYPDYVEYYRGIPKNDGKIYLNLPHPGVLAYSAHSSSSTSQTHRSAHTIREHLIAATEDLDRHPLRWDDPHFSKVSSGVARLPSGPPSSHISLNNQNRVRSPVPNETALIQWTTTGSKTHSSPAPMPHIQRDYLAPLFLHQQNPSAGHDGRTFHSTQDGPSHAPSSLGYSQYETPPSPLLRSSRGGSEVMEAHTTFTTQMVNSPVPSRIGSMVRSNASYKNTLSNYSGPVLSGPYPVGLTRLGSCPPESAGSTLPDAVPHRRKEKAGHSITRVQAFNHVVVITPGEGKTAKILAQDGAMPIISIEDKETDKKGVKAKEVPNQEKPKWRGSKKSKG